MHDDMMASITPLAPVRGPAGAQVVVPRRLGLSLRSQATDLEQLRNRATGAPHFRRLRVLRSERGRDTVSGPETEDWGAQARPAEASAPGPASYPLHPQRSCRRGAASQPVSDYLIA